MDQETLFTSSKWEVLRVLSKGQKSPIELAKETKTSIANISQQLRMLELANIVKSERVGNRERGEPRLLYSLIGPISYIITATNNFAEKKQMTMNIHQEITMKIWFLKDESNHYYLQKYFWEIEPKLEKIDAIISKNEYGKIKLLIVSDDADTRKEIKSKDIRKSKSESRKIEIITISKNQVATLLKEGKDFSGNEELIPIYDPSNIFEKIKSEVEGKK